MYQCTEGLSKGAQIVCEPLFPPIAKRALPLNLQTRFRHQIPIASRILATLDGVVPNGTVPDALLYDMRRQVNIVVKKNFPVSVEPVMKADFIRASQKIPNVKKAHSMRTDYRILT